MSSAGKNIRKIRTLKGYSQNAFAELFDVKRANIGAYEEGRAEPKTELVIEIAKFFGISMELLLTRELTVNELSRFELKHQGLDQSMVSESTEPYAAAAPTTDVHIPIIRASVFAAFLQRHDFPERFTAPGLQLPVGWKDADCAFEVAGPEMEVKGQGLKLGDLVLAKKVQPDADGQLPAGYIYILVDEHEYVILRLVQGDEGLHFSPDSPDYSSRKADFKRYREIWRGVGKLSRSLNPPF